MSRSSESSTRRVLSRALAAGVCRFARAAALFPPAARVAVAVSGGSDSVALLRLLVELERDLDIAVVGVVHVNHQLRGEASDDDERFCRALAVASGRPIQVERIEVRRLSGPDRRSPEDAAREARYEALARGRLALAAGLVALGHTRDDQAETVLLRLLRGAGPDGLAGIPPRRGPFVRPVLGCGRAELRRFLKAAGQPWVEDATNHDRSVPRNLLRHEVLPALERWVPHAGVALARHAGIAHDEAEWLGELVNPALERFVHQDEGSVVLAEGLRGEAPALQRRIVLQALRRAGVRQAAAGDVEAVRLLLGRARGRWSLPGTWEANRIAAGVVLMRGGLDRDVSPPAYRYSLGVPGAVRVPEASAVVEASASGRDATGTDGIEVRVDGDELGSVLAVRNWQHGDLIRPVGLSGRKKLQDIFVDAKVPRPERHRLPLVVDAQDRVLWVPGLAMDGRLRVTGRTKAVVILRLTKERALPVGGPE